MNKTSKILLAINIILVIILIAVICLCVYFKNSRDEYLDTLLYSNQLLYNYVSTANEAGYFLEEQEDGTFVFVENTEFIEEY